MFASPVLTVTLTLVFLATGVFSLIRLARLSAAGRRPLDRLAELFHLVMSLAMIGMSWGWSGGPETRSGLLQIVVFGVFGLWFAHALLRRLGHDPVAGSAHLVMAATIHTMAAAMPVLMGVTGSPSGVGGHAGHGGHGASGAAMSGMDPAPATAAPVAVVALTVGFVLLLVGFAAVAPVRAVRSAVPGRRGVAIADGEGAVDGVGAVAVRTVPAAGIASTATRLGPWSHALMSLGMAVMLVAML